MEVKGRRKEKELQFRRDMENCTNRTMKKKGTEK